jgi:hypothetical protein
MYHQFESTENAKKSLSDLELESKVNNSVAKDATYYGEFEGNYDGGDGGGAYAGLKNMHKTGDGCEAIGDALQYIPSKGTEYAGQYFEIWGIGLKTISDFSTMDTKTATNNLIVRGGSFIGGNILDGVIGKSDLNPIKKYFVQQITRKTIDAGKDELITNPKE